MADISKLINQLASQEKLLSEIEFIAPCIGGGSVVTAVDNIVYTLKIKPEDFIGWGIFQAINNREAQLVDEANLPQISEYLQLFPTLRLYLAYPLKAQTWLAYPVNESDMEQRFKIARPVPVHLVTEATTFDTIIGRGDRNWWFADLDRRASPEVAVTLNQKLQQEIAPENLTFSGMTPEMKTVYSLVWQQTEAYRKQQQIKRSEDKLKDALKQGDGTLETYRDRGEYWQVEWRSANGEFHSSAIDKQDLTVISSGICLSGRDRDFDLQSLVGVMDNRYFDE
ncbi:MAG: hypothetical protein Tsb0014_19160 [Pleurocapsa sp.]